MRNQVRVRFVITFLLLVGAVSGAFGVGYQYGYKNGEKEGHDKGYSNATRDYKITTDAAEKSLGNLQQEYGSLLSDYNNLRSSALQYINSQQYQARQPVSCTSNTIGAFTYTNCY
jgi:hypothetical protein